jgi:hypothetical protein
MRLALPPVVLAVVLALLASWTGLGDLPYDYELEAMSAVDALAGGDPAGFLVRAPAYGGSLVLRAPLVLAADRLGGGTQALWLAMALPALLASVALAVVLWRGLAARGCRRAAWLALAVVAFNPVAGLAVEIGHPEEVVGAVLCAGAALMAVRGHAVPAGLLLGLAGANKPWAIVAALPVLLALPRGHLRAVLTTGLACAAVLAPLLLVGSAGVASAEAVAVAPATIFKPLQVFWFLGDPSVTGDPGARIAPAWLGRLSHPLAVLAGGALALAWIPARRRGADRGDAVLLLALVLLVRCMLDTWTMTYYYAPFLLALATWEAGVRGRAPLAAAGACAALMAVEGLKVPDAQAAATLCVTLPLAAALALRCFAPRRAAALAAPARAASSGCGPGVLGPAPTT